MFVIRKNQIEAMKVPIRKRKRKEMLAQLISNGYNAVEGEGNEILIVDSRNNQTRLVFDDNFVPQKIVKPSGVEYSFTFDSEDHMVRLGLPGNESIRLAYRDDLLVAILLNEKNQTDINYDEKGRITDVFSDNNKPYKIKYNISNQVESITDRANEIRQYSSSIHNKQLIHGMKDALGRITQIETDPMGEMGDKIIFPDGTQQRIHYDENLDAIVTTLRNGAKSYTYYEDEKPKEIIWLDGNFLRIESEGELVNTIENPVGKIHLIYDDKGRILSEQFQDSKIDYTYDEDGNITDINYPSGLVVKYGYDEDGRISSLAVGQDICTFSYADNDTLSEIKYPNGLVQKRNEKILGGLQSAEISNALGEELVKQTYLYDSMFLLTNYVTSYGANRVQRNWQMEYDAESRLLQSRELRTHTSEQFGYDRKGNLINDNGKSIQVGKMDEVLSYDNQQVLYDGNGNIRSYADAIGRAVTLTFNDNNELKLARIGNDTWDYWYDGLGRRVGKSNGKEAWKFCWGSEKLLSEELKTSEGTIVREYIYCHNSFVPVAFRENGQLFWLHSDLRGAVTQVFDSRGQVVWSAEYNAFGDANILQNSLRQPWRLTGQYFDAETGLHYNTARYYSPHLKSFLSLDRYWYKYEASNYGYAGNDPYNKIDVDGNYPEWLVPAASTTAGIAAGIAATAWFLTIAAPAMAAGTLAAIVIGVAASVIGSAVGGAVEMIGKHSTRPIDIIIECVKEGAIKEATSIWNLLPFLKMLKNINNVSKTAKAFKQSKVKFRKAESDLAEKSANLEKSQEKLKKAKETLYEASEKSSKMKKSVKKERKAVNQAAIEKEKSKQNYKDKKKDYNNFKNEEVKGSLKDEGYKKAFNVGDLNENENENENENKNIK